MSGSSARLTVYFGERDRSGGEFLGERIMTAFEDGDVTTAVLLRGGEGFGSRHALRTSGQLSLSEDLPMVAVALDFRERIEAVAKLVRPFLAEGLLTVEPVETSGSSTPRRRMASGGTESVGTGGSSLTVWTARHARIEGVPAHVNLINSFRQQGLNAAIAMPGVDGLADGVRRRAGFFSANRSVPMLVIGVGHGEAVATARDTVFSRLPKAVVETLEYNCSESTVSGETEHAGQWRLTVFGDGVEAGTGIHRQRQIVRMLRGRGASGVTAYFGHYGFAEGGSPHGDSIHSIRRQVPVLTEVVDSLENCRRWIREIDDLDDCSLLKTVSPVELISRPAGPA